MCKVETRKIHNLNNKIQKQTNKIKTFKNYYHEQFMAGNIQNLQAIRKTISSKKVNVIQNQRKVYLIERNIQFMN